MKLFYGFINKNYIIYPLGNPSFLGYNIMYVVTFLVSWRGEVVTNTFCWFFYITVQISSYKWLLLIVLSDHVQLQVGFL